MIDLAKLSIKELNELLEENEGFPIRCKIINKIINERKEKNKKKERELEIKKMAKIERKKRRKEKKRIKKIRKGNKESLNKILEELDDLDLDFLGDVIDEKAVIDDQDAEKFHKKDNLNDNMMNRLENEIGIRKNFNQTRQFRSPFANTANGSDYAPINSGGNITGFRK